MTARYAQIKDQTLRREWERYQQRINIRGEIVPLDPDRAAVRRRVGQGKPRARQADAPQRLLRAALAADLPAPQRLPDLRPLPHHRPSSCPPPRAAHRTEQLIADARDGGRQRLVEINEPVRLNLVRIIDGLGALERTAMRR